MTAQELRTMNMLYCCIHWEAIMKNTADIAAMRESEDE